MKKLLFLLPILLLMWCSISIYDYDNVKQHCNMSGHIVVLKPRYYDEYMCIRENDYCQNRCSELIKDSYWTLNDTRGNKWWFPESVSKTLDRCLEKCN